MPSLAGIHDFEGIEIAAPDSWLLDLVAISESPQPKIYPSNFHWVTRISWGYGSSGTLPLPSVYEAFAQKVAAYVNGCTGCKRWIIGNEPNLSREWPDNTPIYPWHYAACYKLCREAIHALPGHGQDEVLIAGSGPWNDELKYDGNKDGDWIIYFEDTIDLCGDACDGYSIHAYTHGYDVNLVTSSARMNHPFGNRYYEFYTYRDYCDAIPPALRHLPVYLSECNGNGPWQAVGLMPAMLQEVDSWNHSKLPKIHNVIFYRYPKYDQFYIEGRGDVIAEYRAAVSLGYQSPIDISDPPGSGGQPPRPEPPPLPDLPPFEPDVPPFEPDRPSVDWDFRLTKRGCILQPALIPSDIAPLITTGKWFDPDQAQGRVNVYVRLLDEKGKLAIGVPVTWFWDGGKETKLTERKSDPWLASKGLGAEYSLDFAMYNLAPAYGVRIEGDYHGDIIDGCGLGSLEQPDWKIHTAYFFQWQLTPSGITVPPTPIPPPVTARGLLWPVVGPVTQYFGRHEIEYPGSPGHDGLDFGIPVGTPVVAVADGIVKWVDNDPSGFGLYIRIFLPAHGFHGVMAHLSKQLVTPGQRVTQGETIGLSGNSGNSTGPHLHYSTRIGEEDAYFELHDGYANGCANPLVVHGLINKSDPNMREEA